ncbi:MAG: 23S rRNA (uracil(1939)-C(5))-methyltransferase RlmD [Ruminococcus sp.]
MDKEIYCRAAKKCSGCQLSNMDYNRQLRYKQNELRLRFNRLCPMEKIIPSPKSLHYRNKAQFVFKKLRSGEIAAGIYQSVNQSMVEVSGCALHTKEQNHVAAAVCKLLKSFKISPYDRRTGQGTVKSLIVRQSFSTGEIMALLVINSNSMFPCAKAFSSALVKEVPKVSSVIISKSGDNKLTAGENPKVIYGKEYITDKVCGLNFIISCNSFFQINSEQAENLYKMAIDMADLRESDTILDAYCGTGTIGMIASKSVKKVYSVELNKSAVRDAKQNARLNNINNVSLVCADSKDYIKELKEKGVPLSAVFLDPPRAGCSRSFLEALADVKPPRIVYISCNIDTQLRDIRYMQKQGYKIEKFQGVDMFPYTKHIENIVLMSGLESK